MALRAAGAALAAALAAAAAAPAAPGPETWLYLRPVTAIWEHLEEGPLRGPRGVFYDRRHEELWVADTGNHRVAVFNRDGLPLYSAAPGAAVREPRQLVVDADDRLLVLDNDASRVAVLDWRGRWVGPLALPGLPEAPRFAAIALDADDNLYLGEDSTCQVLVYGADRKIRFRFGRCGDGKGEFKSIAGIAADGASIVVTDHQATAVQVFDRHGSFERGFGRHEMGIDNFSLPEAVVLDGRGQIVIVDTLRQEIKVFGLDGRFRDRFGGYGSGPGRVAFPAGLATDGRGRLFVAERGGNRVQILDEVEVPAPPRKRRR